MAEDKMNDNVGRKIVEALKMQTIEDEHVDAPSEENYDNSFDGFASITNEESDSDTYNLGSDNAVLPSVLQSKIQDQLREQTQFQSSFQSQSSVVDNVFQQSIARNLGADAYAQVPDDFDYPANVAVLRQLISKLPAGVSKQTGAVIIRQTMEALGISMPSVIQEAKQVQETLVSNSKECQANIIEYRKQIGILEAKSQQYQRQSAVMNDIINLFIKS